MAGLSDAGLFDVGDAVDAGETTLAPAGDFRLLTAPFPPAADLVDVRFRSFVASIPTPLSAINVWFSIGLQRYRPTSTKK